MKKLLIAVILLSIGSSVFSQGGWTRPNYSHGTIGNGYSGDSAIAFPTGCGAPNTVASINLYSKPIKKANIYLDSCNHMFWFFDPKTLAWDTLHAGIGGLSRFGLEDIRRTGNGYISMSGLTFQIDSVRKWILTADTTEWHKKAGNVVNMRYISSANSLTILNSGSLTVDGNESFIGDRVRFNTSLGMATMEIPLGKGPLGVLLDSNANATTNGNLLYFQQGNATKDFPISFYTQFNQNSASLYSNVQVGFSFTTSPGTGKPYLITTQGYNNNSNAGDIILRPGTAQNGLFTSRQTGNANVDIDPLNQGVAIIRNTARMNVSVQSGSTTITNSAYTWEYSGSSNVAWNAPTVSGNSGNVWEIKNRGSGTVTLTRQGSDLLYSSATTTVFDILPGETWRIQSDGTYIIIK